MFTVDLEPQHEFLAQLPRDEREQLLQLARVQRFRKGELVFQAGARAQNVYMLTSGRVKVFHMSPVGKEVIQWFCFPGEMFGLAELTQTEHRAVYAQASLNSEVLVVGLNEFRDHMTRNPATAMCVINLLSNRLRSLGSLLLDITADDVRSRVMKLLTRLSRTYGTQIGNEIRLELRLTHQELADMIGASRQTVTTILGDLRREGWLRIHRSRIQIASDTVHAPSPIPAFLTSRDTHLGGSDEVRLGG